MCQCGCRFEKAYSGDCILRGGECPNEMQEDLNDLYEERDRLESDLREIEEDIERLESELSKYN